MNKISIDSARAFNNNANFKSSNTTVTVANGFTLLRLHSNLIAQKFGGKVKITSANWQTKTTKERLNALSGVSINQKKGIWYLNGKEWNGNLIEVE